MLIGIAAAFLPHTTKPSVASKLAQTNHPVAVPPAQWLPVFLAASTPGPPTHQRRLLDYIFASKAELTTAVGEYNANPGNAEDTYGPINNWDVSGITDMSGLFKDLANFNADISSWDTSGVTSMAGMFQVQTLAPTSSRKPFPAMPLAPSPPHQPPYLPARTSPRHRMPPLRLGRARMPSTSR